MLAGLFADKPLYRKFLILTFILMFSAILFSMIGEGLSQLIYGTGAATLSLGAEGMNAEAVRFMQLIASIGTFIVPPIGAAILLSKKPKKMLQLGAPVDNRHMLLAASALIIALPVINLLHSLNQTMLLPSWMAPIEQWMNQSEEQAGAMTDALLGMKGFGNLMMNLLVMAVVPALGEELLFRGLLQKMFSSLFKNRHTAIWVTAALFSAMHMQFYGFLPRMMLGAMFGYLLLWSGSIWVPILAHFVNNALAVVFSYIAATGNLPFDEDTVGATADQWPVSLISIALLTILLFALYRSRMHEDTEDYFSVSLNNEPE